ncbi:vegetative incompatibility het-e-1 [Fusarium longipes]|uniref:Vegetative incompatibility het-e-1 n=1 Tax=Fusarium longipes TaxID=694270 RepID=A0A395T2A2_9HYPO|nr:vegetative incompatibility het-e-1 [Fusarium longipes]
MALVLRQSGTLKPEIRLAQAVSEFEALLTSEQKLAFKTSRDQAVNKAPTMSDVMRLTAEVDLKATSQHGRGRCFGPRMTNTLQAIQQFAALGDIVVGGGQNLLACGVWAVARMALHEFQQVITGYFTYLESLSLLFMAIGRNSPRYQAMAALYPRSKRLQGYMCEYFIIITKLCHHSLLWTKKSALGRFTSTVNDPQMKNFKDDLDLWSATIKEEANLLLSQKIFEEAKENSIFRSLAMSRAESSAHQRKVKICNRFLDACSKYDYRKTWKQTRKCGSTKILESCQPYQQWKKEDGKASIVFLGKLGAGKSVLMANIVDDLNLQNHALTLYFFVRYDNEESMKATTILGCLIRQLLEHIMNESNTSHLFSDTTEQPELDKIVYLFRNAKPKDKEVSIILDGLDECEADVQRTVLSHLNQVRESGYKTCLSVRKPQQVSIWQTEYYKFQVFIPDENPDISDFIEAEVNVRVADGRLETRDPNLVEEVKKELKAGANGMFLWASLQLDSICTEVSDHDIREAIKDLPHDLTETFKRILFKASLKDSKKHHVRIFKLLASAREPLTAEQLRQAASVTIGQTNWTYDKEITSIQAVLKFCGGLVMVDEEDDTVRFIHHSALSFCIDGHDTSTTSWVFTQSEADLHMVQTLITYLNYNVFETQVTKNVVPQIVAKEMPKIVAMNTMSTHHMGNRIASNGQ